MTSYTRYVCDYNQEHEVDTTGPMPADWLQMTLPVGMSGVFDSIDCAHSWYEDQTGN